MKAVQLIAAVCGIAVIAGCGADSNNPTAVPGTQAQAGVTTTTPGTDTSANPPQTSTGPVASVMVAPHTISLPIGYTVTPSIFAFDAKGVRVVGKIATWRSNDANIAVITDTGLVRGNSLGTTKVYGTIDGHTDSLTVTVVTAPATTPPPAPSPGVASFDLGVKVTGAVFTNGDTSSVTPVAGAVVTLTRVSSVNGDTLANPVPAGSATTDANGNVSFKSLTGGSYTVDVTPPAGSGYAPIKSGVYRPTTSDVHMAFTLHKT